MSYQDRKAKPVERPEESNDLTGQLIRDFAQQLGLDLSGVSIKTGESAGRIAGAHGAKGLVLGGAVHLDTHSFDPSAGSGRALLAHELTHLAQMQARALFDPSADAEAEARKMGARAAALMPLQAPLAQLDPRGKAADTGAGVKAATAKAAPKATRPEPASAAKMRREINIRKSEISIEAADARSELNRQLRGIVTNDNVSSALRILQAFSFVDAAALVRSMEIPSQRRLPTELNSPHFSAYPDQILAAYAGLVAKQIDVFEVDHFEELQLGGVTDEALIGFDLIFDTLVSERNDLAVEILESSVGDDYAKRLVDPFGSPQPDRHDGEKRALDEKDKPELTTGQKEAAASLASRAKLDLSEKANAATARDVLKRIRAEAGRQPSAEKEENGGGRDDPLAMFGGALRNSPPVLRYIAERMAKNGALQLLFDLTDTDDALSDAYAGVFFGLMAARPVWKNLEDVVRLLTRGFFSDWKVFDWEAEYAYRLLRVMPLEAQYRFRQIEGGKYHRRLEEEVPRALIKSGEFIGIEVSRDKRGEFSSTAKDYAALLEKEDKATVRRRLDLQKIVEYAEDNKGNGDFPEALFGKLEAFAKGDGETAGPSTEFTFLVRRLDRSGAIAAMIDDLSDAFLFDVANRPFTNLIFMARDPLYLRDHAFRLMSTTFLLDMAVTDRDAYVAFLLIRALPLDEQERFLAASGGPGMDEIWSELHERMRKSRDMHLFVEREGGLDRADVLARLRATKEGETLWLAKRVHELDAQIRIAIAYGDYAAVFDISKVRKAFEIAELDPVVQRHRLYDERPGSVRTEPDPDALPTSVLSTLPALQFLQPLGRALIRALPTITSALDLFFFGADLLVGPRGSGYRVDIEKGLNLAKIAADYTALKAPEGGSEREGRGEDENQAAVTFDIPARQMILHLPNLQLGGFNDLMGGWRVNTGPISLTGLKVTTTYGDRFFSEAKRIDGEADGLNVTSAGFIGPETALAFGALALSKLDLGAEMYGAPDEKMPGKTRGIWLPLPLLFPAILGLIEVASHLGDAFSSKTRDRLTGRRFEFDKLEIKGFATNKGLGLKALTIKDFALNVATTPVQHLENRDAQITRQLEAMSATERAGEEGKKLRDEQAETKRILRDARSHEKDRQQLKKKHADDPKSLSQEELRRLIKHERSRVLGVTLDVGEIVLDRLDSNVQLDSLRLGGISAHGAGKTAFQLLASKGIDRLADPATLDLFGRRVAAESAGGVPSKFDGAYALSVKTLSAKGLGFVYVPSESMVKSMTKLAGDLAAAHPTEQRYTQMRSRLDTLMPDVRAYHELSERDAAGQLTATDRDRLARLRHKLRADFRIKVGTIEASEVGLGLNIGTTADVTASFGKIALRDIKGLGIEIKAIEGTEVHLTVGLFVNMLQKVFHGRETPGAELVASGGIRAKSLSIKGAFAEAFGVHVQNIEVTDLNARVERDGDDAFLINISELGSLSVTDLWLQSADSTIQAPGIAKVENAHLRVHVTTRAEEKNGEKARSLAAIRVDGEIGRISYDGGEGPLTYEAPAPAMLQPKKKKGAEAKPPARMRVSINGGALGGIKIVNFTRSFNKGEAEEGKTGTAEGKTGAEEGAVGKQDAQAKKRANPSFVEVKTIDALSVAGIVHKSLSDEGKPKGITHELKGTLSGNNDKEKPEGVAKEGAVALRADFVEEALSRIRFAGMDLSDGLIVLGNNRVTIRALRNLAGDVEFEGDDIIVHGLSFDLLRLGKFRWRTESGTLFEAKRNTTLKGFSLSGRINRDENGDLKEVKVTAMKVGTLSAGYFRYHDPKKQITAVFGAMSGPSKGIVVKNLVVTGLEWSGGFPSKGSVKMEQLDTVFDVAFAKKLEARGELGAKALQLDFFEKDRVVARFKDGHVDALVKAGGKEAHVDVDGIQTGDEVTGKDGKPALDGFIEYRHGEGMTLKKLRVERVALDKLIVDSPTMGLALPIPPAKGTPAGKGEIALEDIKVSAEVAFHPSTHEDAPPVQKISITELEIPKITAKGMEVTLKSLGAVLTLPETHQASILDVKLGETDGKSLFTVEAEFDETTGDTAWGLTGLLTTGKIDVPKFNAALKGSLDAQGALSIAKIDARFLGGSDYKIDLHTPSLSALEIDLAKSGMPLIFKLLRNPGGKGPYAGAEKITLTPEGIKVLKGKTGTFELKLTDPELTVQGLSIDGTPEMQMTYEKPSASGAPGATDKELFIKHLKITNANVHTPDLSAFMTSSGSASGGASDPLKTLEKTGTTYEPLLNSASGHVNFHIFISRTEAITFHRKEPIDIPIRMPITNGRANLSNVVREMGLQVQRLVREAKGNTAASLLDTVRTDLDADSIDLQLNELIYNTLFTPEVDTDWATLAEIDLRDPPSNTVPSGVSEASVPLRALFRINPSVGTPKPPEGVPVNTGPVNFSRIDVDLTLSNSKAFPFKFGKPGETHGELQLAPDGIKGLKIGGQIQISDTPGGKVTNGKISFGAERARLQNIDVTTKGGSQIKTGSITINSPKDGLAAGGFVVISGNEPKELKAGAVAIDIHELRLLSPNTKKVTP
ncbi:eCIS core domain-containing protein [Ruegeria hyattellae]|uniref:eCIS core domain-containing protein n=1 Tax=Ruegeria hyattellae TaxID=3233337 RepID=UPI00355B8F43